MLEKSFQEQECPAQKRDRGTYAEYEQDICKLITWASNWENKRTIEGSPFDYTSAAETLHRIAIHLQAMHARDSCQTSDQQYTQARLYGPTFSYILKDVVARPHGLCIKPSAVLQTRIGRQLERKGYLTWMVICPIAFLFMFDIALSTLTLSEDVASMKFLLVLCGMFSCWALLHMMNKDVFFRVAKSFECIWIIACSTSIDVLKIVSMHRSLHIWSVADLISEYVSLLCTTIPLSIIFATVDSLQAKNKAKLALVMFAFAYRTFIWLQIRFINVSWDETETCIAAHCGPSLKAFALAGASQVAVFMLKAFVVYARGQRFAFLHPIYTIESDAVGLSMPVALPSDLADHMHTCGLENPTTILSL